MSKRNKGTSKKKRGDSKRRSPYEDFNISPIAHHKRQGAKLAPPLAQLPMMSLSSWMDDHMPEMLWAVMLTGVLKRKDYLEIFRQVAVHCRGWFERESRDEATAADNSSSANGLGFDVILDHTKLAAVSEEQFTAFIQIPLRHALGPAALRPILLLDSVPGIERWREAIRAVPDQHDWKTVAAAVAGVLDHQSERATDVRWFKFVLAVLSGRMHFPESVADVLESVRLYPAHGDMRRVRPFIRSAEMMMRRSPPSAWPSAFWDELLRRTGCVDPSSEGDYEFIDIVVDPANIYAARVDVHERYKANLSSDRADSRLDSACGFALYALSILEELCLHRTHTRILGRLALRSLAEGFITIRYLAKKDAPSLWKSYRVYGAGQAKLAFLKAQEVEGDLPSFIDEDALYAIANEDVWQEFLEIDIGHWARSNLRQLAIDGDTKEVYDKFYDWTSSFAHTHWGAIRDTNFVTCHNPLHRLHRIPRQLHRNLNSVERDAVDLVNGILRVLEQLYPSETRLSLLPPV